MIKNFSSFNENKTNKEKSLLGLYKTFANDPNFLNIKNVTNPKALAKKIENDMKKLGLNSLKKAFGINSTYTVEKLSATSSAKTIEFAVGFDIKDFGILSKFMGEMKPRAKCTLHGRGGANYVKKGETTAREQHEPADDFYVYRYIRMLLSLELPDGEAIRLDIIYYDISTGTFSTVNPNTGVHFPITAPARWF